MTGGGQREADPSEAESEGEGRTNRKAWVDVVEVLDRWYEAGTHPEWPAADYFKVAASDANTYLIKHDLESDEWFLIRRW